ncbi:hypothetical protein FQN50_001370 [Emmonsiellopsis sp. PD_5]|nr:hypothetical protein FQN50_001370 [Emmonsiellopsis sp. PD_5]
MSFFPRFPAGDFTPLFRLLDDYESHRASGGEPTSHLGAAAGGLRFAPRFDVREDKDAYHLDGELPGINQKDIDIEFIDSQTLVIKGHTKREYTASSGGEEPPQATGARQPTVEDEEAEQQRQRQVTRQGGREVGRVAPEGGAKFWVSERSVGEFSRSFNFPTRVNQEAVKASLKNGILSVVIPKAHAPTSKRITVE